MRHVRAQLVGAAGHRLEREPGHLTRGGVDHGVIGHRVARPLFAVARHAHERVVLAFLLGEERRDAALARLRHARDQRPVDFSRRPRAEGLGQRGGRKPRLRNQEAAGGVLVEPVHQARALTVRIPQRLEHPVEMTRRARAALHRKPHGLVEHQHVGIFVERDGFEEFAGLIADVGVASARARLIQSQRRDAHRLPGLEPLLGLRALAVHAQFALSNDSLDVGEGEPGEPRLDKAIDAHAGLVGCDFGGLYAARGWRAFADDRTAAPL